MKRLFIPLLLLATLLPASPAAATKHWVLVPPIEPTDGRSHMLQLRLFNRGAQPRRVIVSEQNLPLDGQADSPQPIGLSILSPSTSSVLGSIHDEPSGSERTAWLYLIDAAPQVLLAADLEVFLGEEVKGRVVLPIFSDRIPASLSNSVVIQGLFRGFNDGERTSDLGLVPAHATTLHCELRLLSQEGVLVQSSPLLLSHGSGLWLADVLRDAGPDGFYTASVLCDGPIFAMASIYNQLRDEIEIRVPSL